jgi:prepilin-type N-terminal cleavage/methylation domain-containing protein
MSKRSGFTLIELLIVVAIIAILAAIAVPNFLEAQTRSKISRMKSDMRSAATAIEAYQVDWNKYPFDGYNRTDTNRYNYWFLPFNISTPVSYITSAKVVDVFRKAKPSATNHWQFDDVRYRNIESTWGMHYTGMQTPARTTPSIYLDEMMADVGGWVMTSIGPDFVYGPSASSSTATFPGVGALQSWPTPSGYPDHTQPYDATNGTISYGDIHRSQLSSTGYVNTP